MARRAGDSPPGALDVRLARAQARGPLLPARGCHVDSCSEMSTRGALPRADGTANDVKPSGNSCCLWKNNNRRVHLALPPIH